MSRALVLAAVLVVTATAVDETALANPIRKVVTMLQNMQKKVAAEGEKEKELYEKFQCYCKNAGGDLAKSIAEADGKASTLPSAIEEAEASKKQLDGELKAHQAERSAAKAAMAEAEALRSKEAAAFAAEKAEATSNIDAVGKALDAIIKGSTGSFIQTGYAQKIKQLMLTRDELDADRQDIMAFLAGGQGEGYAPNSGEIIGILKTMKENMAKTLAEAESAEAAAVSSFEELVAAKTKEVAAASKAIETKTVRMGEVAVSIVQLKNDLSDTEAALAEDKKFLGDLDKNCAEQTKAFDANSKIRSEELVALADTIKLLNDDDALDLFKKTLPTTSTSFIQKAGDQASIQRHALEVLRRASKSAAHRPGFDFITLAMQGKQMGFEKVIKMIDGMVETIKKEQVDDQNKKEYCASQFDSADDKKKELTKTVSDLERSIEEAKEGAATLASEIEALEDGIKALDKSVTEATEQRKEEHEDFTALMASDAAAKELLKFAMNRLNKFYNPKLYKPPPKRALSEEDQIVVNMGGTLAPTAAPGGIAGTGITEFSQVNVAPPPEAVSAYKKKGEESGGVIAMINLLIKDLDKEMDESKVAEKDAQADYEQMLNDSAEKRAVDTKALTEKNAAKAGLESDVAEHTDEKSAKVSELMATDKFISSLHGECDWLLQYFDARTEARNSETDALTRAKAILSGADYSLLQNKRYVKFLGGQKQL